VIRVGVLGACGRMGQTVCRAVAEAPDLELVAAVDRANVGEDVGALVGLAETGVVVAEALDALTDARADVAVDFTHPEVVMDDVRWCLAHGVHLVVGTTGVTRADLSEIEGLTADGANAVVASNFALGAVLMQRFAAEAVQHFPAVEIIELHHDGKADAPSGTALATARRLEAERAEAWHGPSGASLEGARGGDADGIRIHSVRLPGLVAHQEVIFGGPGQTLTIRHDSSDRTSFMPGVLMAVRAVASRSGLTVGLEPLLDLPAVP
jgi:4-hydroxy-tetrahydrodipicolinate reductase